MTLPDSILRRMSKEDRKALGRGGMTVDEAFAKADVKKEAELQNMLVSLLTRNGIICNRSRMDKRKTDMVGFPDIVFAIRGQACAWEVKMPGKKLEPEQVTCINAMRQNGWDVVTIFSYSDGLKYLQNKGINP